MKNPFSRKSPSKPVAAEVDWEGVRIVVSSAFELEIAHLKDYNPRAFEQLTNHLNYWCNYGIYVLTLDDGELEYRYPATKVFFDYLYGSQDGWCGDFDDFYYSFLIREEELGLNTGFKLTHISSTIQEPRLRMKHLEEYGFKSEELTRILQEELTEIFATRAGAERR